MDKKHNQHILAKKQKKCRCALTKTLEYYILYYGKNEYKVPMCVQERRCDHAMVRSSAKSH